MQSKFFQYHLLLQVKIAALQNLVKIMSLYYDHMESYMGPALFAVSTTFCQYEYVYATKRNELKWIMLVHIYRLVLKR